MKSLRVDDRVSPVAVAVRIPTTDDTSQAQLREYITVVADVEFLAHGKPRHQLPAGTYEVEVQIKAGHKPYNSTRFTLIVPLEGVEQFQLS